MDEWESEKDGVEIRFRRRSYSAVTRTGVLHQVLRGSLPQASARSWSLILCGGLAGLSLTITQPHFSGMADFDNHLHLGWTDSRHFLGS